jgi:hypothetical protein
LAGNFHFNLKLLESRLGCRNRIPRSYLVIELLQISQLQRRVQEFANCIGRATEQLGKESSGVCWHDPVLNGAGHYSIDNSFHFGCFPRHGGTGEKNKCNPRWSAEEKALVFHEKFTFLASKRNVNPRP